MQDIAQSFGSVKHELVGTDINGDIFPIDPPAGTTYQVQNINKPWPAEWKGTFDLSTNVLSWLAPATSRKKQSLHLEP